VTRVAQNRNVLVEEEDECEDPTAKHLKTLARSLPAQGAMVMTSLTDTFLSAYEG